MREELLIELKKLIEKECPKDENGLRDVSAMLSNLFIEAGFTLMLRPTKDGNKLLSRDFDEL